MASAGNPGVAEVAASVETRNPGSYAGSWIEHAPALRLVVRFVHETEAIADQQILGTVPIPIDTRFDAEYSLLELNAGLERINQDFAWYETPDIDNPRFFTSPNLSRPVDGTILRTQMVGQWVCHFGRKTGQSCGVIDTIRYRPPPNFCNNTTCSDRWPAIISDPNIACYGGDSGGPYWSGNIAYGMHTGGSHTGTEAGQCPLAILMSVEQLSWDGVNTRVMVAN